MTSEFFNAVRTKTAAALLAAVFAVLVSQILITTHAVQYGDEPHEHDGQVCVLSIAASDSGKLLFSVGVVLFVALRVWRASSQITQTERALIAIRAARPRGPPSH